jgi:hypothetical protein
MPLQHELEGVMEKIANVVIHATPTSQKSPPPLVEAPCRTKLDYKSRLQINENKRFVFMEFIQ